MTTGSEQGTDWLSIVALIVSAISVATVAAIGIASIRQSRRSAKASEASAAASEVSAETARESLRLQGEVLREEKSARLVFTLGHLHWEYDKDDPNAATIKVGLRNEGLASAYDTMMGLYFHASNRYTFSHNSSEAFDDIELKYRREYTSNVIPPGAIQIWKHAITKSDYGDGTRRHITLRITYRDRMGEHRQNIKIWIGTKWRDRNGPVFSEISECLDGVLEVNQYAAKDSEVPGEPDLTCPEQAAST